MEWKCIVCEKTVEIISPCDDENGLLPNLCGGTFSLKFGYGSTHDQCNEESCCEYQGCICDDCFAKNKEFVRYVRIVKTARIIPEEPKG